MRIPLSWLREFVPVPADATAVVFNLAATEGQAGELSTGLSPLWTNYTRVIPR